MAVVEGANGIQYVGPPLPGNVPAGPMTTNGKDALMAFGVGAATWYVMANPGSAGVDMNPVSYLQRVAADVSAPSAMRVGAVAGVITPPLLVFWLVSSLMGGKR